MGSNRKNAGYQHLSFWASKGNRTLVLGTTTQCPAIERCSPLYRLPIIFYTMLSKISQSFKGCELVFPLQIFLEKIEGIGEKEKHEANGGGEKRQIFFNECQTGESSHWRPNEFPKGGDREISFEIVAQDSQSIAWNFRRHGHDKEKNQFEFGIRRNFFPIEFNFFEWNQSFCDGISRIVCDPIAQNVACRPAKEEKKGGQPVSPDQNGDRDKRDA